MKPAGLPRNGSFAKKSRKSFLAVAAAAILFIALLVVGVLFSINFYTKSNLGARVGEARSSGYSETLSNRDSQVNELVKIGAVEKDSQVFSSFVDACYIDHSDRGASVQSYNQKCYMQYVDVFEAKLSKDEYFSHAKYKDSYINTFLGITGVVSPYSYLCTSGDEVYHTYPNTSMADYLYIDAGSPSGVACKLPSLVLNSSVAGYAEDKLVYEQKTTGQIDNVVNSKNYVVLLGYDEYFRQDIGCKAFSLFCRQPYKEAVFGNKLAW